MGKLSKNVGKFNPKEMNYTLCSKNSAIRRNIIAKRDILLPILLKKTNNLIIHFLPKNKLMYNE